MVQRLGRAIVVWLALMATETVHGIIRTWWLQPRVGDARARQIAVFTGSALILGIAAATVRWIGVKRTSEQLAVGALWLVLTLGFEVALTAAMGASWRRFLSDYDVRHGGLMPIGLVILTLAPYLAYHLRNRS